MFPKRWLCKSLLINKVNTEKTFRNNKLKVDYHHISLPFYRLYLYNPVELSPRQWRPWHCDVSWQSVYDSQWSLNQKCLDKTFNACPQGLMQTSTVQGIISTHPHTSTHTHPHNSVMTLGSLPCQDVVNCPVSRHWVTMALSPTLYSAGGNTPTPIRPFYTNVTPFCLVMFIIYRLQYMGINKVPTIIKA